MHSLYVICWRTGSQCSVYNATVTWSRGRKSSVVYHCGNIHRGSLPVRALRWSTLLSLVCSAAVTWSRGRNSRTKRESCGQMTTVWSPCYTRAISERFRDKELIIKRCINSPSLLYLLYFTELSKRIFDWSNGGRGVATENTQSPSLIL